MAKKDSVPEALTPAANAEKAAPQFPAQDAQALVNIVRSAPIPNMDAAEHTRALLERFVAWYNSVNPVAEPKK